MRKELRDKTGSEPSYTDVVQALAPQYRDLSREEKDAWVREDPSHDALTQPLRGVPCCFGQCGIDERANEIGKNY